MVTRTAADWTEIPTNAKTLDEEVKKLRQSLTFETDEPFDAALSYAVYRQTFGPVAEKLAGKTRLSVLANGALTSIPLGILITSDPQGKKLRDEDWLIRSYAVTSLPSLTGYLGPWLWTPSHLQHHRHHPVQACHRHDRRRASGHRSQG